MLAFDIFVLRTSVCEKVVGLAVYCVRGGHDGGTDDDRNGCRAEGKRCGKVQTVEIRRDVVASRS